jgi:hypothetical protein
MLLVSDGPSGEATLEEMPVTSVAAVEPQRVPSVQLLHAVGQLHAGRLEDDVIVRSHQAVGVNSPSEIRSGRS